MIGLFIISSLISLTACHSQPQKYMGTPEEQSQKWEAAKTGIANPASTNCIDKGYSWSAKKSESGEYGICTFHDGSWCEEWAFYRGNCAPGMNVTRCGDEYWGKTICTEGYEPVCAKVNSTGRWEEFNNPCSACISTDVVVGYRPGPCEGD